MNFFEDGMKNEKELYNYIANIWNHHTDMSNIEKKWTKKKKPENNNKNYL